MSKKIISEILKERSPLLVAHAKKNKCYTKVINNTLSYRKKKNITSTWHLYNTTYGLLFLWDQADEGRQYWEKLNNDFMSKTKEI